MGLDRAEVWVAITGGGAGLEDVVRLNFPRVEAVILDFYHAAEYPARLATALHPADEVAALPQAKSWSRLLRDEGGDVTIAVLGNWEWPGARGLAAVRAEVLSCFRNQVDRMDDPGYETAGWYIGSGAVESACKAVVGQRLKGSGIRIGCSGWCGLSSLRVAG